MILSNVVPRRPRSDSGRFGEQASFDTLVLVLAAIDPVGQLPNRAIEVTAKISLAELPWLIATGQFHTFTVSKDAGNPTQAPPQTVQE